MDFPDPDLAGRNSVALLKVLTEAPLQRTIKLGNYLLKKGIQTA